MASANVILKWVLIIMSPLCLVIIVLLYQTNNFQSHFYYVFKAAASSNRPAIGGQNGSFLPPLRNDSRLVTGGQINSFSSLGKELVFIGPSSVTLTSNMSDDQMDTAFFNFISKRHFACENSIRLGNMLDGGWDMCIAQPYRPQQPCLVYSFGINYDFSFDDAVAAKFNCTVRSFDPSMKSVNDHQRSQFVWFYKIGIGGENFVNKEKWSLKTLPTIIASFNETDRVIDYLKMDVENSEWPSLVPMLANDSMAKVKQLGIEFHFSKTDAKSLYDSYLILRQLENAGFMRWHFAHNYYNMRKTKNGFRSCCYEMVYINTRFIKA